MTVKIYRRIVGDRNSRPDADARRASRAAHGPSTPPTALALGTYTAQAEQADVSGNVGNERGLDVRGGHGIVPVAATRCWREPETSPTAPTRASTQTANLILGLPTATVQTFGDNAYPHGSGERLRQLLRPHVGAGQEPHEPGDRRPRVRDAERIGLLQLLRGPPRARSAPARRIRCAPTTATTSAPGTWSSSMRSAGRSRAAA